MLCNKCNQDGGNGKYCNNCGNPLGAKVECPNCHTVSSYAFCPQCATQLDKSYTDKRLSLLHIYGATLVTCDQSATQMTVPDCVTEIDEYAFGLSCVENVIVPNSVLTIGNSAFTRCRWLEQVTIASSVKSIGAFAFSKCEMLKDIYYQGTIAQWNNVQKGEDWSKDLCNCTIHCNDGDLKI